MKVKAKDLDKEFESGADVTRYLDLAKAR